MQLATSAVAWSELRDAAIRVETLGYDSVWLPDHLMAWEGEVPRFEAWQALAGIAAATSRIRLGPLVSPVTFRHPGVLAKMASTLDHISDGRLILGLGAGGMAEEHRRYGLPLGAARERARRVEEAVPIIRSGRSTRQELVPYHMVSSPNVPSARSSSGLMPRRHVLRPMGQRAPSHQSCRIWSAP